MKKYHFPPHVIAMSDSDYKTHCAAMAATEKTARDARKAERAAIAARRAETRAQGPAGKIGALLPGQSVTLQGYTKTTQISAQLRRLYIDKGARYSSSLAHDLLTGETVTGVTVLRIS